MRLRQASTCGGSITGFLAAGGLLVYVQGTPLKINRSRRRMSVQHGVWPTS